MATAVRQKPVRELRGPIKILANREAMGTTYALEGEARLALQENFPGVHVAPTVYVGVETQDDFERVHGKFWKQIAILLTGLPTAKLKDLGVILWDPFRKRTIERIF